MGRTTWTKCSKQHGDKFTQHAQRELRKLNRIMQTTALPYLAHGPIGQSFAEQSQDFGYLYDRGQSVAWVKSRWSVGDKGDLLLKAAIGDYCTELYLKYPANTPRLGLLLDSRFRQGVLAEAKPHLPKWKFSEQFDQNSFLLG